MYDFQGVGVKVLGVRLSRRGGLAFTEGVSDLVSAGNRLDFNQ